MLNCVGCQQPTFSNVWILIGDTGMVLHLLHTPHTSSL